MTNSRRKGHNFERHIVKLINDYIKKQGGTDLVKRNLDQTQYKGQADIYWDNFAIECKRYGQTSTNMYKQACRENVPVNNQVTYMCSLRTLCKEHKQILKKASVFNK